MSSIKELIPPMSPNALRNPPAALAPLHSGKSHWIDCDAQTLRANFDRVPFALRHNILNHPLFNLDRLTELGRFLESCPGETYVDVGVSDVGQRWDQSTMPAARLGDIIRELAATDAWIILRKSELDPEYRRLLNQCLSKLCALIGGDWGRATRLENAIIFLTSPRRLSTYH